MSDVLVLNASYEPLNVANLERAVRLLFTGKAEVVSNSQKVLHSPSFQMPMPSIIRMLYYIGYRRKKVGLTKRNVILRDNCVCQYCGVAFSKDDLTVDHIIPKSKGGPATWENLVAACQKCNSRKNNRTPKEANMLCLKVPKEPKYIPWIRVSRNTMPHEWRQYFFFEVSIDEKLDNGGLIQE